VIVLIITKYELNTGVLGSHESIKQRKIIKELHKPGMVELLHKPGMVELYKKLYNIQKQTVQVTCMPLHL